MATNNCIGAADAQVLTTEGPVTQFPERAVWPPTTPSEFLKTLWGDIPPGKVLIWMLPDKKSRWYAHFDTITADMRFHEHEDVYTGIGLAPWEGMRLASNKRLREWEVAAITAFWADIDVAHPVHKKSEQLPPSIERAMEAIAQLPFEATIIVNSGHGLQLWWVLKEIWLFADAEEREQARRACQWWHRLVKETFAQFGWTVDSTFDLPRVMRLPGTWNNKNPQERRRVEVTGGSGTRYGRELFTQLVPEDFKATPMGARRSTSGSSARFSTEGSRLVLDPEAQPSFSRMDTLLKLEPKFRATWEKRRPDLNDQSASAYDMALANFAVRAKWPDQEVANLLIAFRREHDLELKLRENYYAVTIAKAHEPMEKERAEEDLQSALDDPPEDQPDVLQESLSIIFGVDIRRIIKYLGDPPEFYMETAQGNITLGTIDNIYSQTKFQQAVGAATGIVIQKVPGKIWEMRVQAILSACEEIEVGDASHPRRATRRWVEDYLLEKPPREEDWEKAVGPKSPFVKDGTTHMFVEDFCRWLEFSMNMQLDDHKIGRRLRQIGMEPKQVNVHISGARTTRYAWIVPSDCLPDRSIQRDQQQTPNMPGHHGKGAGEEPRDEV